MAITSSSMLPLHTKAPAFNLPNILDDNKMLTFEDLAGQQGTVIIFMCNHCPFVLHLMKQIVNVAETYQSKGINFVGINANDVINYPQDSPENMILFAKEYRMNFPYLFDKEQSTAKAFDAACTPDFYLFNKEHTLVYRGRFDHARPGKAVLVTGENLIEAMDALIESKKVIDIQFPSLGCNIKWKE